MSKSDLPDMIVKDLMRRWPQTVPIFIRHRMRCPGCLLAPFMTLAEAAAEHGVDVSALERDIMRAIDQ